MKNLIVFTLIFLFSKHLYAVWVPDWKQDTNCNSFFGENKKWKHDGQHYLDFYKEASEELSKQLSLFKVLDHPKLKKCVKDNYGFEIPFKILNKTKFATYRLAEEPKGFSCRFKEEDRFIEGDDYYSHNREAWNCFNNNLGKKEMCPGYWIDRNDVLRQYSSRLEGLGRVSFKHYCAKNVLEAYTKHYKDKSQSKDAKECFNQTTINLSDPDFENKKEKCTTIFENINYANVISTNYLQFNENGFSDEQRDLGAIVPRIQRFGLGAKLVDGEWVFAHDAPVGEIESLNGGLDKPYTNKDLVNDMVTLSNFDDNVYDQYKNDMKALEEATKAANKKMELTKKILDNGLDKVANCLDSTGVDSFIIDSFKDSGCGNNLYDEMMSSVTLQDISKVIDGIKNDYTSDFAKQANEVSFKKGLETFFKYASDDLKNVMSNEKAFCQLIQGFNKSASIGDAGGGEWDIFEYKKFDKIINSFDEDNGSFPTSQYKEYNELVDRVEFADGYSFSVRGNGLVCDERSALKTPYKKMFQGLKEKSATNSPTNEEVKDDINKFLNEVNKDCNELLKYPYTSVCSNCSDNSDIARTQEQIITDVTDYPKRLEYETSIKEKYFEFMSDHKNSTTHLAMLDLVSKKSKDFADTFKTLSDSFWGTGEITTHDQMGFCNSRYKNGKDSLMTPDDYGIDEEDVKKLKRELDYQLLRGVAESDDIPSGPGIYNCGDDPREALRLYKLFMSYPRSLRALLDKAEDASQKMLFTKSICDSVNCINNNRDDTVAVLTTTSNAISLVEGYAHSANKAAGAALRVAKLAVDVSKNRFLYGISEEKLNTLTRGALNDEYNDEEAVFNALVESIDNMQELDDELTKIFSDFAKKEAFTQGIPVLSKKLTDQEFMTKLGLSEYTEKVFEKLGISGLDKGMKEKFVSSYIKSLRNAIENYDDPTNLVLGEVVQSVSRARYGKLVQVERMKKIKDTMEKTGQTVFEIKGTRFTTDEWSKRIVDAENGINSNILSSKFVRGHARTSKKVIKSLPPINNTNSDNDKN